MRQLVRFFCGFALALAGMASIARAFTPSELALICPVMGELAGNAMLARQNGLILSEFLSRMHAKVDDPEIMSVVEPVIFAAWEVQRYSVEANKTVAITDFRNEFEIVCYRNFK